MQSGNITTTHIVAGVVGAAAGFSGTKLTEYFIESFFGNKYSKKALTRLKSVKDIYETIFRIPVVTNPPSPVSPSSVVPDYWELKDGRPVFCFTPDLNYHAYLDELEHKRKGTQNYYDISKSLSKYISSYLAKRQNRLIDNGKKGDFLELFYVEWLRWSAISLPPYEYSKDSILEFEKRLQYLTAVRKKANLFPYSKIPGDITKHNVLDFIERELKKCIAKTKEEMERLTAHDHFKKLKDKSDKMLNECLSFIFYNRKTSVHEIPLLVDDYLRSSLDSTYSSLEQKTLPFVTASHTGEMLRVLIRFAQIDDEKSLSSKDNALQNYYFNIDFSPRDVKWDLDKGDFPDWVPKVLQRRHLMLFQELTSAILDFIEMKKLIDKAYALCTFKGTLWAYGSKQGKESVLAQLKSYENTVAKLSAKIADIDRLNNELQAQYNTYNRENYDSPADFNLKDANYAHECFSSLKTFALETTSEIQKQIYTFPIDIAKKVNKLEREYCRDVKKALLKHAPEDFHKFNYPEFAEDNTSIISITDSVSSNLLYETFNLLQFSCYELPTAEFKHSTDPSFAISIVESVMLSEPWQLGDSYDRWMKGFFVRHNNIFQDLKTNLSVELSEAIQSRKLESVDSTATKITKLLESLTQSILDNRPKWRLNPLTAGWPFNRKAAKFANILTLKLNEKKAAVKQFVSDKKEHIKACLPSPSAKPLVSVNSAYQNSTSAVSLALAILREQRTSSQPYAMNQSSENVIPIIFKKWRVSISDLVSHWAEDGFSEILTLFPTEQSARDILTKFLSYRSALGSNVTEFLALCKDIKASYSDYISSNSIEIIDSGSRYQLNLLMRLVDVLSTVPHSEEYKIAANAFDTCCIEFSTRMNSAVPMPEESKESVEEMNNSTDLRHGRSL